MTLPVFSTGVTQLVKALSDFKETLLTVESLTWGPAHANPKEEPQVPCNSSAAPAQS